MLNVPVVVLKNNGSPTVDTWQTRPCGICKKVSTKEGHDACLGTLPGVVNACCGHGIKRDAYVQFLDYSVIDGEEAIAFIKQKKREQ